MTIEEHYHAIAPRLTNWLVSTGSSYHEACDLVQNVFLKIWKMRDDLRDDDSAVSGLAYTIARNLRKNLWRDGSRTDFVDEVPEPPVEPRKPALAESDAAYLRKRLSDAFEKLPPVLREAYTLFQVAELPVREIARQTGVTENLIKVRVFRAKQKLREILADLQDV